MLVLLLDLVSTRSLAPMVFFCDFMDFFPVLYAYLQSYLCARALLPSATLFLGIFRPLLPRAAHSSLFSSWLVYCRSRCVVMRSVLQNMNLTRLLSL